MIYLDYNATAPVRAEAAAAVARALTLTGNASSVHRAGRAARAAIDQARDSVAALVGADPSQVVFTSGGTEANNLALGVAGGRTVLASTIEHASVLAAVPQALGLAVTGDGVIDLDAALAAIAGANDLALVSVMLANNETGAIQPIGDIARAAHAVGALVHCDAVQAAGKIAIDMPALGIDMMTLSAHKLGGPQGVGALIVAAHVALTPILAGGGQERRRRAGTENLPGIAGFGAAAAVAARALEDASRIAGLRDRFERGVIAIAPDARIHASGVARLPNTSLVGMPGVPAETQVIALDLAGVAVSAGAACSSGKVETSHVLLAMGLDPVVAREAIRVSFGWASSDRDLDGALAAWEGFYRRTRPGSTGQRAGAKSGSPIGLETRW